MKKFTVLLLLLSFLNAHLYAQSEVQWSDPVEISASGNSSAVIDLLDDGSPIAVWGQGSSIFFSKSVNGIFSTPVQLSSGGQSPSIYSFGGLDMAVHGNTIYIVFEQFTNGVFLIRSLDGGDSFDPPVSVYDPIPGKWATLPSVEVNENGNPLVSVILENTNETEGVYILMRSTDQGQSFSDPVIANDPAAGMFVCECCPSTILSKGENVWLVFRNNNSNLRDIWVTKSTDNGDSFTEGVDVDATDWVLNFCPISGPKITPLSGDSLITAWTSGASGSNRLYLSTLDGASMEKGGEWAIPPTNTGSSQKNPAIAGNQDTIAVVWEETGFGSNSADLLLAFSTEGSDGLFSEFINITQAPGFQVRPSLAYSKGIFHLIYASTGGVLLYQRGEITTPSKTFSAVNEGPSFQLLRQLPQQNRIELQYKGSDPSILFDAYLYDAAGKQIQYWNPIRMQPNERREFQLPQIAPGIYVFTVLNGTRVWSEQLLITK